MKCMDGVKSNSYAFLGSCGGAALAAALAVSYRHGTQMHGNPVSMPHESLVLIFAFVFLLAGGFFPGAVWRAWVVWIVAWFAGFYLESIGTTVSAYFRSQFLWVPLLGYGWMAFKRVQPARTNTLNALSGIADEDEIPYKRPLPRAPDGPAPRFETMEKHYHFKKAVLKGLRWGPCFVFLFLIVFPMHVVVVDLAFTGRPPPPGVSFQHWSKKLELETDGDRFSRIGPSLGRR
jgi:hypothetical protein